MISPFPQPHNLEATKTTENNNRELLQHLSQRKRRIKIEGLR